MVSRNRIAAAKLKRARMLWDEISSCIWLQAKRDILIHLNP